MKQQNYESAKISKKIWIAIIFVVIIVIVVGGGIYVWQKNNCNSVKQGLQSQIVCPVCLTNQTNQAGYKEFRVASFGLTVIAEIPKEWSMYQSPDNVGTDKLTDLPTASIGQNDVAFGDMNWSQVDLYFAGNDISAKLVQAAKDANYGTWSVETISGIKADVVTYPLDDGKVTKGGSGGKMYFLSRPSIYGVQTVVIRKQALGDEEFENGFKYFIDTLKFTKS